MTNKLIEQIREGLNNKGVVLLYIFYPRVKFEGAKILSCTKHSAECVFQSGTVNQKITIPFGFMSDGALEAIRDALIE